jgi:hypothetical protein
MPLTDAGIKEHVFNILTEAGYETVGQLMFDLKTDQNKVLGLAGIGAKAIQNIEESLAALTFPEPAPAPEAVEEAPAVEAVAESAPAEEMPAEEKPAERKKEPKRAVEEPEEDGEVSKDGVNLDELFSIKPEMFQGAAATDEESDDKKKGKKGKKKGVALEFDEKLGEVVSRKKHKRGEDGGSDDSEW